MYHFKSLCITLIMASTLMVGCGENVFKNMADSDSEEAQTEEAKIALDKGNYTEAAGIFEELCNTGLTDADLSDLSCDETTQADLASAYIGLASGFDVLKLISMAEEAVSVPKVLYSHLPESIDSEAFTDISSIIDIEFFNQCVADIDNCNTDEYMTQAIAILKNILEDNPPDSDTLTDVEKNYYLQLTVASALDIVINVGIESEGFCDNGIPKNIPSEIKQETVDAIVGDIDNIADGLIGSGLINFTNVNLRETIEGIKDDIDIDNDEVIEPGDIQGYITDLQEFGPACE